jgi:hypothetical protein
MHVDCGHGCPLSLTETHAILSLVLIAPIDTTCIGFYS